MHPANVNPDCNRSAGDAYLRSRCGRIYLALLLLLPFGVGCNTLGLGNGRLVKELQSENERLMGEFRAERNRRESTEKNLRVMERRLAESEKLLARQFGGGQGRLSQLSTFRAQSPFPSSASTPYRSGNPSFPPVTSDLEGNRGAQSYNAPSSTGGLRWRRRSAGH